jgi:hypothetical protein
MLDSPENLVTLSEHFCDRNFHNEFHGITCYFSALLMKFYGCECTVIHSSTFRCR